MKKDELYALIYLLLLFMFIPVIFGGHCGYETSQEYIDRKLKEAEAWDLEYRKRNQIGEFSPFYEINQAIIKQEDEKIKKLQQDFEVFKRGYYKKNKKHKKY
ncbi:MAG: hypothetical protein LBN20_06120 [Endomicrobium sp.]|nr:hypothetical protein [Endomicrobium sp.]